jgi:hypothetical protein
MKPGLSLALVMALAGVAAADLPGPERTRATSKTRWSERDEVYVTPSPHVTIEGISIDNRLGDVRVRGWDRPEIRLSVKKQAPDEHTLDRLKVQLLTMPDGSIRIRTTANVGVEERVIPLSAARIDLVVEVPRSAKLGARAWNGDVDVSGMRGGASLDTDEGTITVHDVAGKVETHTAKGRQSFDDVRGDVAAEGVESDVELDGINGSELTAKTFEGSVTAHAVRARSITLQTTLGRIEFHGIVLPGGKMSLRAYRGDVVAVLSAPKPLEVVARGKGIDPLALGLREYTPRPDGDGFTARLGRGALAKGARVELGAAQGVLSLTFAE